MDPGGSLTSALNPTCVLLPLLQWLVFIGPQNGVFKRRPRFHRAFYAKKIVSFA
jgi:hypothetical protein